MDDIVRQAMAKWPNVPHCHGWLGLDARGDWYMRDDAAQAAGPFPRSRGSRLVHDKLVAFIGRNYGCDAAGCWYFQNGPQRVYVELECAPWVWRLHANAGAEPSVVSHTGQGTQAQTCLLDETGRLYLNTGLGLGLVHTLDMSIAADAVERGGWAPQDVQSADLPARFGFVRSPQAAKAAAT